MDTEETDDLGLVITGLERDISVSAPVAELAARVEELRRRADSGDVSHRIRVLIAKGTIENRQGNHEAALFTAHEARQLALGRDGTPYRSRISRLIATVYSWRGSGEKAMAELLRAVAEARIAGDEQELIAALGDGGRACKEIKRYDLALFFFQAVSTSQQLTPLERQRVLVIQLEMLNRLGRHSECLAAIAAGAASTSEGSPRTRFLWQLERARALAGTGETTLAAMSLAQAKDMLPQLGDYEPVEWSEADRDVAILGSSAASDPGDISADEARLQNIVERSQRDALHEREADARLELAQVRHRKGDLPGALQEAAAALAIAVRRHEPRIEERARSAMLRMSDGPYQTAGERSGLVLERYLLGDTLGKGGYGLVKRAYDLQTGGERAVKFIDLDGVSDVGRRKRLLDDAKAEIDAAGRVRHPGLIRIHTCFVDGDTIAIVEDVAKGDPLESRRGETMRPRAALELFARVAHALAALHHAGMVHRDLKPANIMIDPLDRPVVIDLGLAAIVGGVDGDKAVRGTRNYIAPELLVRSNRPAPHPRQDIYALGVILDEFLPATLLVRPSGLFGLAALAGGNPLAALVDRMKARAPERRPATMEAIAEELERHRDALAS